ncbi:HTH domain-containing protein, partial [Candidatus Woesearchaeota archaeon]|nr:HTH domain-containing protein [Candidatus Woesearchaeota archaeon]
MFTRTQEQILIFLLSKPEEQLTIRGIAKRLGKSYTLVYNNIAKLEKESIIRKQNVPPGQIITLNEFAPTEIFVDIELKRKKEFLKKYPWVQVMLRDILLSTKNLFFTLLVFGSYAKATQTKSSDFDLLIIVQGKKDIKDVEYAIDRAYTKVKKGLNFVDINDFRNSFFLF